MIKYIYIFLLTLISLSALAQKNTNALEFVENKGQWDKRVVFAGELDNGAFFLRKSGFTVVQHHGEDLRQMADMLHGHGQTVKHDSTHHGADQYHDKLSGESGENQIRLRSHAYTMDLEGASASATIEGDKALPGYNNYFLGKDTAAWASNCRIYSTVIYKDIYPGIDIRYYTNEGSVKYEFLVHPGADPGQITMRYDGVERLSVKKGELVIGTSVGELRELQPYTYQLSGKERISVPTKYRVTGTRVKFNIGKYDPGAVLVIDPTLRFSTFTGSRADNWGYTATYGGDGTLYSGGIVFGTGFPVSPGAFQTSFNANSGPSPFNMGIMKFSADGTQRVYATYIGGNASDQPHSLIVNSSGHLIIAGRTSSNDYPALETFGKLGGWDIVLTELNASGSALVGSIKVGGRGADGINTGNSHSGAPRGLLNFYGDDARSEVILDDAGYIYLASCSQSDSFYVTPNAPFKSRNGAEQDAILIKATPNLSTILLSTYFGGKGLDAAFVIGVSKQNGDIWISGATNSDDIPGDKSGTIGPAYKGGDMDGFIAIFSNDGSVLKKSTYIGTQSKDAILGFEFGRFGDPFVMGVTYGTWPIINAAYGLAGSKQFVGKLKSDLSDWQYTTCFGTKGAVPNISPVAFLVDRCENLYVSGWGGSTFTFPMQGTIGMEVSPDAIKKTTDNNDFYFIVIEKNASKLLYATFFGQNGNLSEHVDGGTSRYDQNGIIYQAICANCYQSGLTASRPRFPITPGAWCCSSGYSAASNSNSSGCNLAAVKISFNFAGVGSGVASYINGVKDTSGCVPLNVELIDTIQNAQFYIWNFGDGSPDLKTTDFKVNHLYNAIGNFVVRLIAVDSSTCNISDTSFLTLRIRANEAKIDFEAVKLPPCEALSFRFDNHSIPPAGSPFSDSSFTWDFGDGTRVISGPGSINHAYLSPGTYLVRLILNDTLYCNDGDSASRQFYLSPLVKAQFEIPDGCAPYTAEFNNTSLGGMTYQWDFGDGTGSTERNPVKLYQNPGIYHIKLVVTDPNTCNIIDSAFHDLLVQSAPTAGFSFAPASPVENTPTTFSNTSSADAIKFTWDFGDGEVRETSSRAPFDYQFNQTGTYNVCLIAWNSTGCVDTSCQEVSAIVLPRVDLPNAFTPLGVEPNNVVFVRGFGIAKMNFMIFNRFGQKVFQSSTLKFGWDGKYNGIVQPMDVYAYVLDVEFVDGTRTLKKGDITLIR